MERNVYIGAVVSPRTYVNIKLYGKGKQIENEILVHDVVSYLMQCVKIRKHCFQNVCNNVRKYSNLHEQAKDSEKTEQKSKFYKTITVLSGINIDNR